MVNTPDGASHISSSPATAQNADLIPFLMRFIHLFPEIFLALPASVALLFIAMSRNGRFHIQIFQNRAAFVAETGFRRQPFVFGGRSGSPGLVQSRLGIQEVQQGRQGSLIANPDESCSLFRRFQGNGSQVRFF